MDEIEAALVQADLFLSIGTSGTVYPAAGFALQAKLGGARTVELNLEIAATESDAFDDRIVGDAVMTVPKFVDQLVRTIDGA